MLGPCRLALSTSRAMASRTFTTSARRMVEVAPPLPAKRPMGAFRGGYVCELSSPMYISRGSLGREANITSHIWRMIFYLTLDCACAPSTELSLLLLQSSMTKLLIFSCFVCGQKLTCSCLRSIFGFLFGSVLASTAVYSYVLQEYRASNDLLIEDIYVGVFPLQRSQTQPQIEERYTCHLGISTCRKKPCYAKPQLTFDAICQQTLQASVTRLTNYVKALEEKVQEKK